MIELAEIRMTTPWCPTQWDAVGTDGVGYYIRFRHGVVRLDRVVGSIRCLGRPGCAHERVASVVHDNVDGGVMTNDELLETLSGIVSLAPGANVVDVDLDRYLDGLA